MISFVVNVVRFILNCAFAVFGLGVHRLRRPMKDARWLRADYEVKKNILVQHMLASRKGPWYIAHDWYSYILGTRKQPKDSVYLDLSHFNRVIAIDTKGWTAEVEGMTTYEDLVDATLKHGLMPAVVPQFKSVSVGSAVGGVGMQSTSFKHGFVHETVVGMEVLLSDGSVVVCSATANADLFQGIPNSYGTLGYILKATVRLVPTKPFVRIRNLKATEPRQYFDELNSYCRASCYDFVDGIAFGPREHYTVLAEFVDNVPTGEVVGSYTRRGVYYKSIQAKRTDYMRVREYMWRWDPDCFWLSKHFFLQNPVVRLLLSPWCLKSWLFMSVFRIYRSSRFFDKTAKEIVIQDVEVPIERCVEFADFFAREICAKNSLYPAWTCPVRSREPKNTEFPLFALAPGNIFINFGFWGVVPTEGSDCMSTNKLVEKAVSRLGGKRSLYSTHSDREEFWRAFDKASYQRLKEKYDGGNILMDLFDKCTAANLS
eukprot:Opistho-2@54398